MTLDLTEDEARALARHLREAIDYARYPFASRFDPLKAIPAKLEPPLWLASDRSYNRWRTVLSTHRG
jgi:hypothetical protein